jgi:hypothetical protein
MRDNFPNLDTFTLLKNFQKLLSCFAFEPSDETSLLNQSNHIPDHGHKDSPWSFMTKGREGGVRGINTEEVVV